MIFSREFFFYPHKIYSFIYTRLFENLKARIPKSIIKWSVMGQQIAQAKKVSELPFASDSKRVFVRNHSNKKRFDLHENGCEGGRYFHMNGFARRFVFKRRQKVTRPFCSAPGIEINFRLQHRKSAIHGLIVKSDKSDWLKDTERELCACSC